MKFAHLGLLGDIHAEARRLEAALSFFHASGVEHILCSGDIADGIGDANRCCHLLQEAGVTVVRGNHDRWLLYDTMRDLPDAIPRTALDEAAHAFLAHLPSTQTIETVAGRLLLCHGVGANDMRRLMPHDSGYALECNDELQALIRTREFRYVVGGHTHHRMVRHFDVLTFINAGTLRTHHDPCLAIADWKAGHLAFHDFEGDEVMEVGNSIHILP